MVGKVYLVGAGPGDYGLLTLNGLQAIQEADVVIYDRLINQKYIEKTKSTCERIYVGKASGNHTLPQKEINELITKKAIEGKIVVRLKGGDPYVFGRGGEEAQYLLTKDIPFEVIPGITSAIGGLCYAGIPVTHREYASSFHVITGHTKEGESDDIAWDALVKLKGTLVFLMGLSNLEFICNSLVKAGMHKDTKVALINWATTTKQKVIVGTLQTIQEERRKNQITSPAIIVVGEVVQLRKQLNFFEQKPLFGKQIVVTRSRKQNSVLKEKLEKLGASVIECPTFAIKPITSNAVFEGAINNLHTYTYIVFTSQHAVTLFFEALRQNKKDARALGEVTIAAIGKATFDALGDYGIIADIMPQKAVAESLASELEKRLKKADKVLLPTALQTREVLTQRVSAICMIDQIPIYENIVERVNISSLLEELKNKKIDYITFTSSSTVNHFLNQIEEENKYLLEQVKLVSIGEITSHTLQKNGLSAFIHPSTYTIDAMIEEIVTDAKKEREN